MRLYAWWLSVGLWDDARTLKCQMSASFSFVAVCSAWCVCVCVCLRICLRCVMRCKHPSMLYSNWLDIWWRLNRMRFARPPVSGEWYVFRFYISAHHYMVLISHCNFVRFPRNIWAGLSMVNWCFWARTHTFRKWWKRSRRSRLI